MLSIKSARVNANLEQVEVAKKLGMTKKTYINYEKYRSYFRVDKAYEFAKIVSCPLDQIIFLPKNYTSSVNKKSA